MNSVTTSSVISELTRVLLDANIIAKPVTRTLRVAGEVPSGFRAFWSRAAEREVHMRPRVLPPSSVRERFDVLLGPNGTGAERFGGTKCAHRQILADAAAAGARFLITEDVATMGWTIVLASASRRRTPICSSPQGLPVMPIRR